MKLAVSEWFPYQHQATALQQIAGDLRFERCSLESVKSDLVDVALGPFLAVIDKEDALPLVGVPAVLEALDRAKPERGFLPQDPLDRATARGLSAKIEECFTRLTVAAIATHEGFGRRIWLDGSEAPDRILDDLPLRLATLERFHEIGKGDYLAGDRPSVADCLLAALWWTAEDMGLAEQFEAYPHLAAWYERNCHGRPFQRQMPVRTS